MFLVNQAMVDLNVGTAGLVAVLGYAVVFVGLIALMAVIILVGKIMVATQEQGSCACRCSGSCRRAQARSGRCRTRHGWRSQAL